MGEQPPPDASESGFQVSASVGVPGLGQPRRSGVGKLGAAGHPYTQFLTRIAVDKYPGDPERSNRLDREDPLTWEEVGLSATFGDEPMSWHAKKNRDAFKEVWLLFENDQL